MDLAMQRISEALEAKKTQCPKVAARGKNLTLPVTLFIQIRAETAVFSRLYSELGVYGISNLANVCEGASGQRQVAGCCVVRVQRRARTCRPARVTVCERACAVGPICMRPQHIREVEDRERENEKERKKVRKQHHRIRRVAHISP